MKQKRLIIILQYIAIIVLVVYIIAPFLWLILMSISSSADLTEKPLRWIPAKPTVDSFKSLLVLDKNSRGETFLFALRNSFRTSIFTVCISLVAAIPASWVFSRYPGKKNFILRCAVFTFMLPPVAYALPLYRLLSNNGMLDKSWALSLVYCTIVLPFCVWLLKDAVDTIPFALEEAAVLDGAGIFVRIFQVVIPLLLPSLGTVALLALIMAWDEYFYAMLFTNSKNALTLPVVISNLASGRQANYSLIAAAGVVTSFPPVLIGMIFQRSLIKGLSAGAVKE
ncbi:carbohydrate ABC transporter permease [Treponema sp. HNW]|uniref:carbohydrate ABC transporter permease n=1 Tax=Treponema sp. HNW TaxID=3116654 RepID=UPI003D0EF226